MPKSYNLISRIDFGAQVCDNCHYSRKKCDRKIPCGRCEAKFIPCLTERQLKEAKSFKDNQFYSNQTHVPKTKLTYDIQFAKKKPADIICKDGQIYNPRYNTIKRNTSLVKQIPKSYFANAHFASLKITNIKLTLFVVGWIDKRKLIAPNFVLEDLLPLLTFRPLSCSYNFMQTIKVVDNQASVNPAKLTTIFQDLDIPNDLYIEATDAFFKHYNPFTPLFTKSDFFAKERPKFLEYIVWLCGATFLEYTNSLEVLATKVKFYLEKVLKSMLSKPTLSLIQALCISSCGLKQHRYYLPSYLSDNIFIFAYQLGLHLQPAKSSFSRNCILERYLAFTCIIHLDKASNKDKLVTEDYYKWDYKGFLRNTNIYQHSSVKKVCEEVDRHILTIIGNFNYRISFILHKLLYLKYVANTGNEPRTTIFSVASYAASLRKQFKDLLIDTLVVLTKLKDHFQKFKISDLEASIDVVISMIILQVSFVQLLTFSFNLFNYSSLVQSKESVVSGKEYPFKKCRPSAADLETGRDYCNKVFSNDTKLGNDVFYTLRPLAVFRALTFLLDSFNLHKNQSKPLILVGLARIEYLETVPCFSFSSKTLHNVIKKLMIRRNIKL